MEVVDALALEKLHKAINTANKLHHIVGRPKKAVFMLGVTNYLFAIWMIGFWPQYYWIFYMVKAPILVGIHIKNLLPQRKGFHMTEFCWVVNICSFVYLVLVVCGALPADSVAGRNAFNLFFTLACGPLAASVMLLHNSLVFHSEPHVASLFIHLSPIMLMWTLRWNSAAVDDAFPDYFPTHSRRVDMNHVSFLDLWLPAAVFYFCWFVPYAAWLLTDGATRDERGYETVYHSLGFEKAVSKHLDPNKFPTLTKSTKMCRALFLSLHCLCCLAITLPAVLCYHYIEVMTCLGVVAGLVSVWNGAGLYTSLFRKYDQVIMELLKHIPMNAPILNRSGDDGDEEEAAAADDKYAKAAAESGENHVPLVATSSASSRSFTASSGTDKVSQLQQSQQEQVDEYNESFARLPSLPLDASPEDVELAGGRPIS